MTKTMTFFSYHHTRLKKVLKSTKLVVYYAKIAGFFLAGVIIFSVEERVARGRFLKGQCHEIFLPLLFFSLINSPSGPCFTG
jgi:hypothetical protein